MMGFFALAAVAACLTPAAAMLNGKVHIKSSSPSSFKVAIFTDLHYGEGESDPTWGTVADANSTRVISRVISYEAPSLAVYLGDVITGNNIFSNATAYWSEAMEPSELSSTPRCSLFGNHDDLNHEYEDGSPPTPAATQRPALLDFDMLSPLSYSRSDYRSQNGGISNYYLLASDAYGTPLAALYFIDSGGGSVSASLDADLLSWLLSARSSVSSSPGFATVPQLLFLHIPSRDYGAALLGGGACSGSLFDDGVTPAGGEELLETMKAANIKYAFAGHDHGNDWCCEEDGVSFCFARHTGYGGYGDWDRGARMIEVDEEGRVKTWVRLEDGSVLA